MGNPSKPNTRLLKQYLEYFVGLGNFFDPPKVANDFLLWVKITNPDTTHLFMDITKVTQKALWYVTADEPHKEKEFDRDAIAKRVNDYIRPTDYDPLAEDIDSQI